METVEPDAAPPLAYLITFTLYGHWLPGDDRGSFQHGSRSQRPAALPPSPALAAWTASRMAASPAPILSPPMRRTIETAIVRTCAARGWTLHAVQARSNHVHLVVGGAQPASLVVRDLKAYATRALRQAGLWDGDRLWTRGANQRWLRSEEDVAEAYRYVIHGQDNPDKVHPSRVT